MVDEIRSWELRPVSKTGLIVLQSVTVVPEQFIKKRGARPARSLQPASRGLVFADERGSERFSRLAAEGVRL